MNEKTSDDILQAFQDPVEQLLLSGQASSVAEAEEIVLNTSFDLVNALLQSNMTDEELAAHPLFVLYRTRGSRPREDDLL